MAMRQRDALAHSERSAARWIRVELWSLGVVCTAIIGNGVIKRRARLGACQRSTSDECVELLFDPDRILISLHPNRAYFFLSFFSVHEYASIVPYLVSSDARC